MAAPIVYRSTDGSAPTLSGTAGDLINLLNKCLVTGYGAKAAAGWSSAFGPTANVQVFRQGGGNQRYVRVDDSGTQVARVRGYEAMGSIADAVNPELGTIGAFPTEVQFPGGLYIRKSAAASATTRSWVLVADDRTFYLFVLTADSAGMYLGATFGEIYSYSPGGDSYNTVLIARTANDGTTAGSEPLPQLVTNGMGAGVGSGGHYLARDVAGTGGPAPFSKIGAYQFMTGTTAANVETLRGLLTYPNNADSGLYIAPVEVSEVLAGIATANVRGRMRGFYHVCHPIASFADGDTFSGAAGTIYAGRSFLLLKSAGQGLVAAAGIYCIETTAWDTN